MGLEVRWKETFWMGAYTMFEVNTRPLILSSAAYKLNDYIKEIVFG